MGLPALAVHGLDVVEKGTTKKVHLVGFAEFALPKRYLMPDGSWAYVEPILVERRQLAERMGWKGPIFLRCFRHAKASNVFGITNPWQWADTDSTKPYGGPFTKMIEFCRLCEQHGFYVDMTAGDYRDCFTGPNQAADQQQHINETMAALVQCPNALFQLVNEPFQNFCLVHPRNVPKGWGDTLRDSGYYDNTLYWDHSLDLDIFCNHTERGTGNQVIPKFIYDMPVAASYVLEMGIGPFKFEEPIGADEHEIPGRRTNRAPLFKLMGAVAGYGVGVYFHSTIGLSSDGYAIAPRQQACAENFWAGVVGAIGNGL